MQSKQSLVFGQKITGNTRSRQPERLPGALTRSQLLQTFAGIYHSRVQNALQQIDAADVRAWAIARGQVDALRELNAGEFEPERWSNHPPFAGWFSEHRMPFTAQFREWLNARGIKTPVNGSGLKNSSSGMFFSMGRMPNS